LLALEEITKAPRVSAAEILNHLTRSMAVPRETLLAREFVGSLYLIDEPVSLTALTSDFFLTGLPESLNEIPR
jgi:hypothetical protein